MPSFEVKNPRELGAIIRHARQQAGLRTMDVAERLNIDRQYLARIESGARNLHGIRLFRLVRHRGLHVTIS